MFLISSWLWIPLKSQPSLLSEIFPVSSGVRLLETTNHFIKQTTKQFPHFLIISILREFSPQSHLSMTCVYMYVHVCVYMPVCACMHVCVCMCTEFKV